MAGHSWAPTGALGQKFGQNAAKHAGDAGILTGVVLWLDLEGVKSGAAAADVILFCNSWFGEVESVGYLGGIYIGASPGLTAEQLYWDLKTTHYWRGGSSTRSGVPEEIPHRGYQLVQRIANAGTKSEFDSKVTKTDAFGGSVRWLSP
jgi:hypothetical protein